MAKQASERNRVMFAVGSTMIYCRSPKRAREVASWLLEAGLGTPNPDATAAADWIARSYDPEWILPRCVRQGIGLHHGRVPRSLQHHMIRHFNAEQLRFLVCTSTLIEGVNTAAQNVVVFDGKLSNKRLDYFTFNNIRGSA
jgi:replicative superfamily II helicase